VKYKDTKTREFMKVLVGGRAEELLGTIIFGVSGDKPVVTYDCDGCPPTGVSTKGSHFTSITVAELIPTVFQK
jgi:hypothetical protein